MSVTRPPGAEPVQRPAGDGKETDNTRADRRPRPGHTPSAPSPSGITSSKPPLTRKAPAKPTNPNPARRPSSTTTEGTARAADLTFVVLRTGNELAVSSARSTRAHDPGFVDALSNPSPPTVLDQGPCRSSSSPGSACSRNYRQPVHSGITLRIVAASSADQRASGLHARPIRRPQQHPAVPPLLASGSFRVPAVQHSTVR